MSEFYRLNIFIIGIIPLYIGYGVDGSVWFSSEMKALQANCSHYEIFPPGHYYMGIIKLWLIFYTCNRRKFLLECYFDQWNEHSLAGCPICAHF